MSLHGEQQALVTYVVAKKLVVVGEEDDAGRGFQGPAPQALGEANLRREGPAMRADVYQLRRKVLPGRCTHPQRHADDRILVVTGKLTQRERGCSIKVDGESQGEITQPRAVNA